jgi:hypothetical protein
LPCRAGAWYVPAKDWKAGMTMTNPLQDRSSEEYEARMSVIEKVSLLAHASFRACERQIHVFVICVAVSNPCSCSPRCASLRFRGSRSRAS